MLNLGRQHWAYHQHFVSCSPQKHVYSLNTSSCACVRMAPAPCGDLCAQTIEKMRIECLKHAVNKKPYFIPVRPNHFSGALMVSRGMQYLVGLALEPNRVGVCVHPHRTRFGACFWSICKFGRDKCFLMRACARLGTISIKINGPHTMLCAGTPARYWEVVFHFYPASSRGGYSNSVVVRWYIAAHELQLGYESYFANCYILAWRRLRVVFQGDNLFCVKHKFEWVF